MCKECEKTAQIQAGIYSPAVSGVMVEETGMASTLAAKPMREEQPVLELDPNVGKINTAAAKTDKEDGEPQVTSLYDTDSKPEGETKKITPPDDQDNSQRNKWIAYGAAGIVLIILIVVAVKMFKK